MKIIVDAMGGDNAPFEIVKGAVEAVCESDRIKVFLVGQEGSVKAELENTDDVKAAAYLGTVIGKKAVEAGIESVVFDRGGYIYHGKVKALADAAREAGLKF